MNQFNWYNQLSQSIVLIKESMNWFIRLIISICSKFEHQIKELPIEPSNFNEKTLNCLKNFYIKELRSLNFQIKEPFIETFLFENKSFVFFLKNHFQSDFIDSISLMGTWMGRWAWASGSTLACPNHKSLSGFQTPNLNPNPLWVTLKVTRKVWVTFVDRKSRR